MERGVHHDLASQVGLLLIPLDKHLVGARVELPVQMFGGLSGLWSRCSANSTLNPWNGLLCMPVMNPSTPWLAKNSSLPRRCCNSGVG